MTDTEHMANLMGWHFAAPTQQNIFGSNTFFQDFSIELGMIPCKRKHTNSISQRCFSKDEEIKERADRVQV